MLNPPCPPPPVRLRPNPLCRAPPMQDLYERPRQASSLAMMGAMEALMRVFALQPAPLGVLRSLGLGLVNQVAPVKNGIMKYAMGDV